MVEMKPVSSSMVSAVGYDKPTGTLHVRYRNGKTYTHAGVPPAKHEALLKASSIGNFLNTQIKGQHPAR